MFGENEATATNGNDVQKATNDWELDKELQDELEVNYFNRLTRREFVFENVNFLLSLPRFEYCLVIMTGCQK